MGAVHTNRTCLPPRNSRNHKSQISMQNAVKDWSLPVPLQNQYPVLLKDELPGVVENHPCGSSFPSCFWCGRGWLAFCDIEIGNTESILGEDVGSCVGKTWWNNVKHICRLPFLNSTHEPKLYFYQITKLYFWLILNLRPFYALLVVSFLVHFTDDRLHWTYYRNPLRIRLMRRTQILHLPYASMRSIDHAANPVTFFSKWFTALSMCIWPIGGMKLIVWRSVALPLPSECVTLCNCKKRFCAFPCIVSGPLMVPPEHIFCQVDFERALAAISEGGACKSSGINWYKWQICFAHLLILVMSWHA